MTRKDISTIVKKYGLSLLISLPIVFIVDIFLLKNLSSAWIIIIDCALIFLIYVLFLVLYEKRRNYITKKRVEFLHKKEQLEKQEQEEALKLAEEQKIKEQEQEKPKKIIQKQKRNYVNNVSKKHKKK